MFVHLHVHSPYSFLEAGSSIQDLVDQAAALEMEALALTDRSPSGAVAFTRAATGRGSGPFWAPRSLSPTAPTSPSWPMGPKGMPPSPSSSPTPT